MMIGIWRVRSSPRSLRAISTPEAPGSIQSSRIRSGKAFFTSISAASAVLARST
ncbi:hypothetical protein D3C85_1492210 [compost metagenome]